MIKNIIVKKFIDKTIRKTYNNFYNNYHNYYNNYEIISNQKFIKNIMNFTINECKIDYKYKPYYRDIVLDIGSCIGGFSIPHADKVEFIYMVEPLFYNILQKNLVLNNIRNGKIFPYGIGCSNDETYISFNSYSYKRIKQITFNNLWKLLPVKPNILKCDCEGCEHFIPIDMLNKFEQIYMEIHLPNTNMEEILSLLEREYEFRYRPMLNGDNAYGVINAWKE